jgi:autonomous glycyl radical cofactor GrcA
METTMTRGVPSQRTICQSEPEADKATLRDAQEHPEKYPDLTVKVSGYSARFVELAREIQEDIIARAQFDNL